MFNDLLKVKFVKGGRDKEIGLDCYGLCQEVYRRIGRELPEYPSPCEREEINDSIMKEEISFVKLSVIAEYALVVFAIRPPFVSHIGVVLPGNQMFIHMAEGIGCCIEKLSHPFWGKRVKGYYQWQKT